MEFVTATIKSLTEGDVLPKLMAFYGNCSNVLSVNLLSMVDGYMEAGHLVTSMPQVYGLVKSSNHLYELEVKCWLVSPNVCRVTVTYKASGS